jgi:hypothetical protein
MLSMMFLGMDLFVFLEVLGAFKRLFADFTYVWFEGSMN